MVPYCSTLLTDPSKKFNLSFYQYYNMFISINFSKLACSFSLVCFCVQTSGYEFGTASNFEFVSAESDNF